jgi:hypothetical protein
VHNTLDEAMMMSFFIEMSGRNDIFSLVPEGRGKIDKIYPIAELLLPGG